MAFQAKGSPQTGLPRVAPGDAAKTGMQKTPAPSADMERETSWGRTNGPGSNGYDGRVVLDPGQRHVNDDLAPSDPVRDAITSRPRGALNADPNSAINGQIRKLSGQNVPDHPFMSRRGPADGSPGATVPAKLGVVQEEPVRQPPSK